MLTEIKHLRTEVAALRDRRLTDTVRLINDTASMLRRWFIPAELVGEVGVDLQAMDGDQTLLHFVVTSDGADSWDSDGGFDFLFTEVCDAGEVEILCYWAEEDRNRFKGIVDQIARRMGVRRVIFTEVALEGEDDDVRPSIDGWLDYVETRRASNHYVHVYGCEVNYGS